MASGAQGVRSVLPVPLGLNVATQSRLFGVFSGGRVS